VLSDDVIVFVQMVPHIPPWHVSPAEQETEVAHWPHASHVCVAPEPKHCLSPGVQTGAKGQEQLPQVQLALHVSVPCVLHDCVAVGAQTPCPLHVPSCHTPFTQVCVLVPHLSQGTLFVLPGAHAPVHDPFTQVWPEHRTALPHCPHASQVSTPLLVALHCCAPGMHTGTSGHEQLPQPQVAPHVCEP
jgi:hypothetical protein